MELILWLLTGAVLGWAAFSYLNLNEDRGMVISIVIGAAGGLIGGKVIAPMFTAPAITAGEFSMATVVFAAAVAAAALAAGNLVQKHWGV